MNRSRTVDVILRILKASALIVGCAILPRPRRRRSRASVRSRACGKQIILAFAGLERFYELTIHPDGSFVAQWGGNWQWGKVTLSGGVASFEITAPGTSTGTVEYDAGPGKVTLTFNSTVGNWSVQVTPVT